MKKERMSKEMQQLSQSTQQSPPLPRKEEKRLVQAEINLQLFNAVQKEMERRGLKIRSVMEWGFSSFLLSSNPKEANRLGITSDAEK